ncbi:hypothetical protein [Tissierella pigra]|uniref:Uncharacterized protein n=1 Tax=Tissierella pigra TaxID=2607614 RepID=A0A6N7XZF2_9FIRM|nr:hypothetical protein [Tissierella pigra]MSU01608.1 hypothetical protein [Tissierella pigra]
MFTDPYSNRTEAPTNKNTVDDVEVSWKDILAMIIAAYQVIFPFVAILALSFAVIVIIFRLWVM